MIHNMIPSIKYTLFFIIHATIIGCTYTSKDKILSENDTCVLLQLTINLPELQQYFHVDKIPNRKPLKLVLNNIQVNCSTLMKFGSPVLLVDKKNIENSPYIDIIKIDFIDNKVNIAFMYSIEGIKGSVIFKCINNTWSIDDFIISEL